MLVVTDLGPEALKELDPTGKATQNYHLRFSDREFHHQPSHFLRAGLSPSKVLEELRTKFLQQLDGTRYQGIFDYEIELQSKLGPQGGQFSESTLRAKLKSYYERADLPRSFKLVKRGARALVRELQARVRKYGLPQVYTKPYIQNTAGGLPTCFKKNEGMGEYLYAHAEGYSHFGKLQPALPGGRRMRNKDRVIFIDSALNVDRINPILNTVRNWFKDQFPELFAALINPEYYLYPKIYRNMTNPKLANLETDFESMDTWVTFEIAQECMLPIFEVLLTPSDYISFATVVENYFSQPLLVGEQLWEGSHSLFSGQSITQDVENFYDICLYLGAYLELGYSFEDFISMFVMVGDDVLAFIPRKDLNDLYRLICEETDRNQVVLSKEKTRKGTGDIRFCRCVYCKALPVKYNRDGNPYVLPAYSLSLASNSILQPENENENYAIEISAIITRSDNARGHPLWRTWAEWILSKLSIPFLPDEEQYRDYQLRDWWVKVYGEFANLSDSPTYQLWNNLRPR